MLMADSAAPERLEVAGVVIVGDAATLSIATWVPLR